MESLFVYKLNSLPKLEEDLCKEIEDMVREFIWCGKKPKIALKTLQLPKEKGGLRLFDIRSKQKSLKIQWVKRALENEFFRNCLENSFPITKKISHELFWQCNIHRKDIGKITMQYATRFWTEIVEEWSDFHYQDSQNSDKVKKPNNLVKLRN